MGYPITGRETARAHALREPTFWKATWVLTRRWIWRLMREPIGLIAAIVGPIFWLLLFGHLFSGAVADFGYEYIPFITAGVLAMTVFGGAWDGGIDVLFDREAGIMQRILAAPISSGAVIVSRLLFVLGLTLLQCLLLLGAARLQGVVIAGGWPGIGVILAAGFMLGSGILCVSIALAFTLSGHTQFFSISSVLSLPLIFMSNALVPLEQMTPWLQAVARVNPLTYAITLMRETVLVGVDSQLMTTTFIVLGSFNVVALVLAIRAVLRAGRRGFAV